MKSPTTSPRARDYLHILSRGWILILVTTALSAGVGWISWQTNTPVYQSTARIMISSPGAATTFDAFYGQINSMSRSLTYQRLAHSSQVTSRTIEQLGLPETTADLSGRIVVPPSATPILEVTVAGTDRDRTRQTADAVATNLIQLSRQMATVDGAGAELVPLDPAGAATRVGSMWSLVTQGAVIGLVLSIILVIARELIGDRLLGRGQVARIVSQNESVHTPADSSR